MRTGGYKIIDFKKVSLSGSDATINGIYDEISNNYDKAIMVTGLNFNGTLKDDAFAFVTKSGTNYNIEVYNNIIQITNADVVTYAASSSTSALNTRVSALEAVTALTVTPNEEVLSTCEVKAFKIGKVAYVTGYVTTSAALTRYSQLFSVADAKARENVFTQAYVSTGTNYLGLSVGKGTGNFKVGQNPATAVGSGVTLCIDATYVIE